MYHFLAVIIDVCGRSAVVISSADKRPSFGHMTYLALDYTGDSAEAGDTGGSRL